MSISSVPWTRSLGLSGIKPSSPGIRLSYWLSRGEFGRNVKWAFGRFGMIDARSFSLTAEMPRAKRVRTEHAHVIAAFERGGVRDRAPAHAAAHLPDGIIFVFFQPAMQVGEDGEGVVNSPLQ